MESLSNEEPNVQIGNLILTWDGDRTKVTGQWQMNIDGHLGANLSFNNDEGEQLGFVVFNGRYEKGLPTFELMGAGDFTSYSTVKFHVGYLNGVIKKKQREYEHGIAAVDDGNMPIIASIGNNP